jgi:hypothetical protein
MATGEKRLLRIYDSSEFWRALRGLCRDQQDEDQGGQLLNTQFLSELPYGSTILACRQSDGSDYWPLALKAL